MSIDALQNKIRKRKNPSALLLAADRELVPEGMGTRDYYCALLTSLREMIPAVRVDLGAFLLKDGGMETVDAVMNKAKELGYYIILDWKRLETPAEAKAAAKLIFQQERWPCDAVNICGYAGSDCVKPYCKAAGQKKDVFVVVKTANKSGSELQDLQTGGRMVFTAAADLINRLGDTAMERCGYSRFGVMAGAYSGSSLKTLREKYPRTFLLVDGVDEPGCNAKNASYAFDRMGHGALVCAGKSIVGAWKEVENCADPVAAAVEAAERMKRNVTRYVTVL